MCGRINLLASPAELAEFFQLFREPEWQPRYNLGPMQRILVVRRQADGHRFAEPIQWGLVPNWAKDVSHAAQMINARSDGVTTRPAFRDAIRQRRCLIPASGFYEWQQINSKTKQTWHIFRADGHPFALAGIWEQVLLPDRTMLESCAVITTDANDFMAEIHDRMPVMLEARHWDLWLDYHELDSAVLSSLLVPAPDEGLQRSAVGTFVNNIHNDSPECIQPAKPIRTLF